MIFDSLVQAAENLGFNHNNVNGAMNREGTAGNYKWYYYESETAQYILENYEQEKLQSDNIKPTPKSTKTRISPDIKQIDVASLPKIIVLKKC